MNASLDVDLMLNGVPLYFTDLKHGKSGNPFKFEIFVFSNSRFVSFGREGNPINVEIGLLLIISDVIESGI